MIVRYCHRKSVVHTGGDRKGTEKLTILENIVKIVPLIKARK